MTQEKTHVSFKTLVELVDKETGEKLVSKSNSIHPQNLARVIARGLANENDHNIYLVALGNGGTYVDSTGVIRYNSPKTTGVDASLYNQTYFEVVDGSVSNGNSTSSIASISDLTAVVNIDMTIDANEPSGQWLTDAEGANTVDNPATGAYVYEFDELGCFAKNPLYDSQNPSLHPEYLLLTHIIFQPIAKSQNRQIQLSYAITISCS